MENLVRLIVAVHVRLHDAADAAKDRGATATEYAVLVSFIALLIIAGVTIFGNTLSDWFSNLAGRVGK